MYRRYEDPHKLEQMLDAAEKKLERMKAAPEPDDDSIIEQYNWIESLKERINFAWQDDEYNELNASY